MTRLKTFFFVLCITLSLQASSPIKGLLDRVAPGSADKFIIEQVKSPTDFFELDQQGDKVVVRGNNHVSIATGIHWYLKYYAGVHLTWNNMQVQLPDILPPVSQKERRETNLKHRYDFNYCTFSYTMAFWDWERWEKEIDWMALHGINLPLAVTGSECVWYNLLTKLGYNKQEINDFIAGPGFMAWWLMNNLEGWGGPNPDNWYSQQAALQQKIISRLREYGIEPVLPGYSGMLPNNAKEKLNLNVADPGLWCSYRRPAFLQPTDPNFQKIASLYYKEMNKLYGKANYYSMDPFHEGGSTKGVDLDATGQAILKAMKKNNPKAVWVIQAWGANPRPQMIENINQGDMLVLDLNSESRPQWGDPNSTWKRENGYGQHDWIYCMLLNFGGNVGLHGKMAHVIDEFYKAKESSFEKTLCGVGLSMEGSENNPVMYELLCELPWRAERFEKDDWLQQYIKARYGKTTPAVWEAWKLLSNSIYNCPVESTQQGATESVFCARPAEVVNTVSAWSESDIYYEADDVIRAARLMLSVADEFKGNNNFEYDLVDIVRQAIAEKGRRTQLEVTAAYRARDRYAFERTTKKFLRLIDLQDELLSTRSEFMLGSWINAARSIGQTAEEKDLYEWNARTQITTWGNRTAADKGGLRDYAHREWNGILKDFYRMRWETFFRYLTEKMQKKTLEDIDFYALEEAWTKEKKTYPDTPQKEVISTAKKVYLEAGF
ncbi:alpha-N-acetylglucosaminidase [Bacteroides sp. UBA939]|uniref:alpha-N-acetylglucosaminidase n=1 Tax=Bacteroides sp. UBA939 TaxID=1946092 RepID=UPI0025C22502|nr:alpha-N-acetylglucosaminidase [Bacteroides sp. UBA939]